MRDTGDYDTADRALCRSGWSDGGDPVKIPVTVYDTGECTMSMTVYDTSDSTIWVTALCAGLDGLAEEIVYDTSDCVRYRRLYDTGDYVRYR